MFEWARPCQSQLALGTVPQHTQLPSWSTPPLLAAAPLTVKPPFRCTPSRTNLCTIGQTRSKPRPRVQHRVQGVLNNVRDIAGKVCMRTLHRGNAALAMATCGAKGSPINIAQMVACVGQQSVGGKRCADGFAGRTIPHFPRCAPLGVFAGLIACLALRPPSYRRGRDMGGGWCLYVDLCTQSHTRGCIWAARAAPPQ